MVDWLATNLIISLNKDTIQILSASLIESGHAEPGACGAIQKHLLINFRQLNNPHRAPLKVLVKHRAEDLFDGAERLGSHIRFPCFEQALATLVEP